MSEPSPSTRMEQLERRGYSGFISIGTGGQANVFLSKKGDKQFAIKVTRVDPKDQKSLEHILRQELQITNAVSHPNCIKVEEIFRTKSRVYLVMDYMPNGTIKLALLKNGPLSYWNIVAWFPPIVQVVRYLHTHNIAHRDLKLENMLLDAQWNPVVSDFGMARYVKSHSETGQVILTDSICGTRSYFSPELLQSQAHNPFKIDIWCLGVTLFTMINHYYPFNKANEEAMLQKQLNQDYVYREEFAIDQATKTALKDLVQLLLDPDPTTRPNIEQVCAHRWMPVVFQEVEIMMRSAIQHYQRQQQPPPPPPPPPPPRQ